MLWRIAVLLFALPALPGWTQGAQQVSGALIVDGVPVYLTHAYAFPVEGLFDPGATETIVLLTDRPLPEGVAPDVDGYLGQLVDQGQMTAARVRLGSSGAVSATLFHAAWDGMVLLPGSQLVTTIASQSATRIEGSLRNVGSNAFEGHSYLINATFAADVREIPAASEVAERTPPSAAATGTTAAADTAQPLDPGTQLVYVLRQAALADARNEDMETAIAEALALIEAGADVNAKDDLGWPPLSWAVIACSEKAVEALVDAGADVTFESAPGYSLMMTAEVRGCPPGVAQQLKRR